MSGTAKTAVQLDLRHHCIETAIRKRYEQALKTYFKTKTGRAQLEEDIALLLQALETLDFAALRSRSRHLAGSSEKHILLSSDRTGRLTISIDGRPLADLPQR
jgi:hypothetical protein